jgi:GH15 family glucan-1,4-alpha-glucosidase
MISTGYKPIADYGVIGNMRSVALIGQDGSIDWCCFPHMDSPSVFAALLDVDKGGRFRLSVAGARGEQRYIEDTNILQTVFMTPSGRITVTDLMPLDGSLVGSGQTQAQAWIHRIVECEGVETTVDVEWAPRLNYACGYTSITRTENGWLARNGPDVLSLSGMIKAGVRQDAAGDTLIGSLTLTGGEKTVLVTHWGGDVYPADVSHSLQLLEHTIFMWRDWAHHEESIHGEGWAKDYLPLLIRSELVIKMLAHAETGAIAAAPTTSLPEDVGGVRNWDYRYSWIRDTALSGQALVALGHREEAEEFMSWIEDVAAGAYQRDAAPQIMYGLHGDTRLDEYRLDYLEGYCGSRPVRVGNAAAGQFQLETYGELIAIGYELDRRGHKLPGEVLRFLATTADHICEVWQQPDYGIWEVRGEPKHFVYSKVMSWHAIGQACRLLDIPEFRRKVPHWRDVRDEIKRTVLARGFNERLNSFVQAFDSEDLDASNLRIALLEFLPVHDKRIQGTIDAVMRYLSENDLVYRYRNDDGLPGREGTFGVCTFWLVDALALSGRVKEARHIFERMVSCTNHLGLYSEQIDARSGALLGNFPQALTHIGHINSAIYLAAAEGQDIPEPAPIGSAQHRQLAGRM